MRGRINGDAFGIEDRDRPESVGQGAENLARPVGQIEPADGFGEGRIETERIVGAGGDRVEHVDLGRFGQRRNPVPQIVGGKIRQDENDDEMDDQPEKQPANGPEDEAGS